MLRLIAIAACLTITMPSAALHASRPVKKTVTACVVDGKLDSGQYVYRVRPGLGAEDTDLRPHEGKRLRVKGYLLPGDILIFKSIDIVPGSCPIKP